jgi:diaminopropionate ammonia-lyase
MDRALGARQETGWWNKPLCRAAGAVTLATVAQNPQPFRLLMNPRRGTPGLVVLPEAGFRRARADISGWPGYAPTPLRPLPDIALAAGVAAVKLKDESGRFGLGSFKALGGAYAVAEVLRAALARAGVVNAAASADLRSGHYRDHTGSVTVTCATDGNHGRAVAWGAREFGCRAVIFVPATTSPGRAAATATFGAEVRRVEGNYDDAVRTAEASARAEGWAVVSDTAYPGYMIIPCDVMQGYRVMTDEAAEQWEALAGAASAPTHLFIQGGVGGLAASVSVHFRARRRPAPMLIVVEPTEAACLLASAETGVPTAVGGSLDTVMAGLACGEPSLLAWQELERGAAAFMAIPDSAAVDAMRRLAGQGLVIGESGVAGLAGLLLAAGDPAARSALGLGPDSRVLLIGTEGATDPAVYEALVGRSVETVAAAGVH